MLRKLPALMTKVKFLSCNVVTFCQRLRTYSALYDNTTLSLKYLHQFEITPGFSFSKLYHLVSSFTLSYIDEKKILLLTSVLCFSDILWEVV